MLYDPAINTERLRKSILAAIAGEQIKFQSHDTTNLIAMFNDPIDSSMESRVRLFQRAFLQNTESYLEIISSAPACLKVTFKYDLEYAQAKEVFFEFLSSGDFQNLGRELGIGYVQFAGRLFYPAR
ncbi:MAG: hypothetical protein ING01_11015 [Rhodobacter sp.]|nr:hypothetical protein [Rhodobacter sp.]